MSAMILASDRLLLPGASAPAPGHVVIDAGRIVDVGDTVPAGADVEYVSGLVAPGYVDVHCHGGGGASFVTTDPEVARTVLRAHRQHGTTTMIASLVTGALDDLHDQVVCLADLVEAGELAGIHLEGPWLSPDYKGAHPAALLRDPVPDDVSALLDAGRGTIRMVTLAPERTGAGEAIGMLAARGVVAAVGHTAADYDTTVAAIGAGARGATHLFNAMAPLAHRHPGPVLALWADDRVTLELIMDGVHSRPELVKFVFDTEPDRVALITDAMAAAGSADGSYVLGELPVTVTGGVARITGTDTIAGSTLTLDSAVANAVAAGVPLAVAVRAATHKPAEYLGLGDVGRIAVGARADLVVLDDALAVRRVLWRGQWQSR